MDAYLSREAYQAFKALSLIAPNSSFKGFLLGHKRGYRYFVEGAFPTHRGAFSSPQKVFDLDKLFDGKLIGFFSFKRDERTIKRILAPFAFGKLFLEVHPSSQRKMSIKSFVIDYRDEFFLTPIRLINQKQHHGKTL